MAFHDREASYKAIVYFKDGNSRTFYSFDFTSKRSKVRKPLLGFARLWDSFRDSLYTIFQDPIALVQSAAGWGCESQCLLPEPNFYVDRSSTDYFR